MSDYDRAVAEYVAVKKILASGAEARLRAIPGVTHVGIGLRQQGTEILRDLCIRVYVAKKISDSQLSAYERIPREIDGVPVDVNAATSRVKFSGEFRQARPVTGGIAISNGRVGWDLDLEAGNQEAGTLGCLATRVGGGRPVLLTNWHVLSAFRAEKGNAVYQPPIYRTQAQYDAVQETDAPQQFHEKKRKIAEIEDLIVNTKVDAAIAVLDGSTWCRCCGIEWKDEIDGLNDITRLASKQLFGMRRAIPNTAVFVSGISSLSEGIVVTDDFEPFSISKAGVDHPFEHQIAIKGAAGNLDQFSSGGDSGSIVVDEDNYAVGLLFGGRGDPLPVLSFANHIADVCSAMKIFLNLVPPPHTSASRVPQRLMLSASTELDEGRQTYTETLNRMNASSAGRLLVSLSESHREEIVALINDNRRVTVVWHRAGGPAMFARLLHTLREGDKESLPVPPEGTLEGALARVGAALAIHGSEELRCAVARHRDAILAAARHSATLTELLAKLETHARAELDAVPIADIPA